MDEGSTPGCGLRSCYVARVQKGYRTMLAMHDQFALQMRNRLKTIGMGLGLVRLLQDAGRIEEARSTLSCLENEFQHSNRPGHLDEPADLGGILESRSDFDATGDIHCIRAN